jgi:G:T-mismatch repair DNA endonuclease (very short patch repair protein)
MNYNQSRKKKLNKLETKGSLLLKTLIDNFEEQYLINNKITVDIYIPDQNLIIQWWGDYWHCNPIFIKNKTPNKTQIKRMNSDKSQHNYLTKCGYKILYFWENEVHKNSNMVLEKIKSELFSF